MEQPQLIVLNVGLRSGLIPALVEGAIVQTDGYCCHAHNLLCQIHELLVNGAHDLRILCSSKLVGGRQLSQRTALRQHVIFDEPQNNFQFLMLQEKLYECYLCSKLNLCNFGFQRFSALLSDS